MKAWTHRFINAMCVRVLFMDTTLKGNALLQLLLKFFEKNNNLENTFQSLIDFFFFNLKN